MTIRSRIERNRRKFITFGKVANQQERRDFLDGLTDSSKQYDFAHPAFASAADVLRDERIHRFMQEYPSEAYIIEDEVVQFVEQADRRANRKLLWMNQEERLLEEFREQPSEDLGQTWSQQDRYRNAIEHYYTEEEMPVSFYDDQIQRIRNMEREPGNKIARVCLESDPRHSIARESAEFCDKYDDLKTEIVNRWQAQFTRKKNKRRNTIIDRLSRDFMQKLLKQIEQYREILGVLYPFQQYIKTSWGLSPGRLRESYFELLQRYAEISQKQVGIRKVADLLGRFHEAEQERQKDLLQNLNQVTSWAIDHALKSELVGIHESDDITNAIASEIVLLGTPETEIVFYQKFAEKKLLTYEFYGKAMSMATSVTRGKKGRRKPRKKGPIIVAVDTSGSMAGEPERSAKVLCFALIRIAIRERRQLYLISFSTATDTIEISPQKQSLQSIVALLLMSFYGGTDPTKPLEEGIRKLQEKKYQHADLVIITDGQVPLLPENLVDSMDAARKRGNRFYTLIIGNNPNEGFLQEFDHCWQYNESRLKDMVVAMETLHDRNPRGRDS